MELTIGSELRIKGAGKELRGWCMENLVLPNPEYADRIRRGLWIGRTPQYLYLYRVEGEELVLPVGTGKDIRQFLDPKDAIKTDLADNGKLDFAGEIPLYEYQQVAVDAMCQTSCGILKSPCGSGKGLPLNAKIYTPDGFTRNADLKIGDEVCNTYGGISKVTGIYDRGKQPCYLVTFSDGAAVTCDAAHLWTVRNTKKYKSTWEVISTADLAKAELLDDAGRKTYEIPVCQPVYFSPKKVTIDPWLLGALLGDGSISGNTIGFSNSEFDIIEKINEKAGASLKHKSGCDYYVADGGSLRYRLMDYGLLGMRSHEKFIPKDYIYNTVEIRLEVLKGIIDTDGSVRDSEITVSSTSKRLMEGCLEIVQSLGGTGKISERHTKYAYQGEKKEGRASYRLNVKMYDMVPFSSQKHLSRYRPRVKYKNAYRRIQSIKSTAPQVTRCITVDSENHLFLTDGFVATHNTQMGIALSAALARKTLWITHTQDLLTQSYERAAQYFPREIMGKITGGKVHIGTHFTFATVQTLCKLDLTQYRYSWDVIIVDECHRLAGTPTKITMFYRVLNNLAARYKFGLSATVHRSDGLIRSTFAALGPVIYQVPEAEVEAKTMKVSICERNTGVKASRSCLDTDGTMDYAKLIPYLVENPERNQLIVKDIVSNAKHWNLILSDRLDHLRILMGSLPKECLPFAAMIDGSMTSKKGKAERAAAIEDMRTGKKHFLFASYSLAKEGLDIPRLDRLYLTTPKKDFAVVTQSIGRIARRFPEKEDAVCYDYLDDIAFCQNQYRRRKAHYRKAGCES